MCVHARAPPSPRRRPHTTRPTHAGTIFSSVVNLVNTVVGAGVLSLPFAFNKTGVVVGSAVLLMCYFLMGLVRAVTHRVAIKVGAGRCLDSVSLSTRTPRRGCIARSHVQISKRNRIARHSIDNRTVTVPLFRFSCWLLLECQEQCGGKSYRDIAKAAMGQRGILALQAAMILSTCVCSWEMGGMFFRVGGFPSHVEREAKRFRSISIGSPPVCLPHAGPRHV